MIPGNRPEDAEREQLANEIATLLCSYLGPIHPENEEQFEALVEKLCDQCLEARRDGHAQGVQEADMIRGSTMDPEYDEDGQPICTGPNGHEWTYTGTQYGGDDESFHGEGRCICIHCGADGDG